MDVFLSSCFCKIIVDDIVLNLSSRMIRPKNYLFLSSFSYFLNFSLLLQYTFWTCKNQFCKLCSYCKHLRSGLAGLQGGSTSLYAFSVDTCVRIRNVTVLWYLVVTQYKLCRRPLLGHWNTILSALHWFPSEYLEAIDVSVMKCPAETSALNPSENAWSILKCLLIRSLRFPTNITELFNVLYEESISIPDSCFINLLLSIRTRAELVMTNRDKSKKR